MDLKTIKTYQANTGKGLFSLFFPTGKKAHVEHEMKVAD